MPLEEIIGNATLEQLITQINAKFEAIASTSIVKDGYGRCYIVDDGLSTAIADAQKLLEKIENHIEGNPALGEVYSAKLNDVRQGLVIKAVRKTIDDNYKGILYSASYVFRDVQRFSKVVRMDFDLDDLLDMAVGGDRVVNTRDFNVHTFVPHFKIWISRPAVNPRENELPINYFFEIFEKIFKDIYDNYKDKEFSKWELLPFIADRLNGRHKPPKGWFSRTPEFKFINKLVTEGFVGKTSNFMVSKPYLTKRGKTTHHKVYLYQINKEKFENYMSDPEMFPFRVA